MDDAFSVPVQWYDGVTAVRHSGTLAWDGGETLTPDSPTARDSFAASDLRFAETRPGSVVYGRESLPDFRLILPGDIPAGLAARLPAKSEYGAWIDRLGLGKAAAIFAGGNTGLNAPEALAAVPEPSTSLLGALAALALLRRRR